MKLDEALRSAALARRDYKRAEWKNYTSWKEDYPFLSVEDILADDWEIESVADKPAQAPPVAREYWIGSYEARYNTVYCAVPADSVHKNPCDNPTYKWVRVREVLPAEPAVAESKAAASERFWEAVEELIIRRAPVERKPWRVIATALASRLGLDAPRGGE